MERTINRLLLTLIYVSEIRAGAEDILPGHESWPGFDEGRIIQRVSAGTMQGLRGGLEIVRGVGIVDSQLDVCIQRVQHGVIRVGDEAAAAGQPGHTPPGEIGIHVASHDPY